jgi:hypothetical protein
VKERKQFYDLPYKKDKELYSKESKVVHFIEETARQIGVLDQSTNVSSLSRPESDKLFDIAFIDVVDVLYPNGYYCNRIFDLTFTVLYNRILAKV